MYNDVDMTGNYSAKLAFIDSGNFSIQVPETMFINVVKQMQKTPNVNIQAQNVSGHQIIVARNSCEELYDTLGDIEFALQGTIMMIKPRGYLFRQPMMTKDCFFGIESIPDSANQYRLGRLFLRNFYTGLDYDNNLIMIGPNAHSSQGAKAYIQGKVRNPIPKPTSHNMQWGWFLFFIIILIAGGVYYFIKHNKEVKAKGGNPDISFTKAGNYTIQERMDSLEEQLDSRTESQEDAVRVLEADKEKAEEK